MCYLALRAYVRAGKRLSQRVVVYCILLVPGRTPPGGGALASEILRYLKFPKSLGKLRFSGLRTPGGFPLVVCSHLQGKHEISVGNWGQFAFASLASAES